MSNPPTVQRPTPIAEDVDAPTDLEQEPADLAESPNQTNTEEDANRI